MADIHINSALQFGVTLSQPNPNPEKPGLTQNLRQFTLRPGINTVDADAYHAWANAEPKPDLLVNGAVSEASDESDASEEPGAGFGFEPALKSASTEGASDGSTVKAAGPVSSADMKPTSDAPAADSPRADPRRPSDPVAPAAGATPAAQPAPALKGAAAPAPAATK